MEAELALARGRLRHTRYLQQRDENPDPIGRDGVELQLFERALELYQHIGDVAGVGEATLWIGLFHQVVEENDQVAVPHFEQARELAIQTDDQLMLSEALRHLGIAEHRAGRLESARDHLEESMRIRREHGFLSGVASNLVGLIYIAAAQGRRDDARALLDEADAIASEAGAARISQHLREARSNLGLSDLS